jgi:3-methyladenine DNA glycosylase AlkC
MAELLKNIYNQTFLKSLANDLKLADENFNSDKFLELVEQGDWNNFELKQRITRIAESIVILLPENDNMVIEIMFDLIKILQKRVKNQNFEYIFIPDIILLKFLDKPEIAADAFEEITKFVSCEFAVRLFIVKYQDYFLSRINEWAKHENENVRRFASESCRPRLPWGMKLHQFVKNPSPIFPILENLIDDNSLYVRKSVANNLNDISKDNPELVLEFAKKWKNKSDNTNWILKHACRTLLKSGNKTALELFGIKYKDCLIISDFKLINNQIKIGKNLEFHFEFTNNSDSTELVRLEQAIYYNKGNGTFFRKIFKIHEKEYPPKSRIILKRKQHFKPITTRKYYAGIHKIGIVVNGMEIEIREFELLD